MVRIVDGLLHCTRTAAGGGTAVAAMIDLEDLEEAELEDAEEVAAMLLAAPLRVEDREAAGKSGTARALPPPSHPPSRPSAASLRIC